MQSLDINRNRVKYEKVYNVGIGLKQGEKLLLTEFELFYALENGLIDKEEIKNEIKGIDEVKDYIEKNRHTYEVFKYLRDNGYIARETIDNEGNTYLLVGKKGFRQGKDRTAYLMRVIKDSEYISAKTAKNDITKALMMKKGLVYAVKENNAITFLGIVNFRFD
ncbi:MAG: hypothetical protein QXS91_02165 [Candidatus Anstonellales archaeon]